jgi:hypothetical protein
MPFWWTRAQWQLQYGKDISAECFANMEVVRAEFQLDERNRYCPAWSAPNKAGCPPKGKRRKSVLEQAKGKRTKARPLTRFCQLCWKYNHRTIDCSVQEKNKKHRPATWKPTCKEEADNDLTNIEAAIVEATLRRTAEVLPLAPGEWQNDNKREDSKGGDGIAD